VHYQGALLDGTVFDSSIQRGQPADIPVSQVVPGWQEGIALMPVGSKYRLWIPAALAYGEGGTPGGPIPPNSTLVFEVELLEILDQPAQ
jgi:FKBP-type peptidyl-prolyl cis-trans isomerase FkpA/FKBP-type peptidyl-prolyl cis-trans isomerase FklB